MMERRKLDSLFIFFAFFALAIAPTPAATDSCSAQCVNALGCFGGCSVSLPDCGVGCWGACSLTCRGFGAFGQCNQIIQFQCTEKPPPEESGASMVPPDWALFEFWSDGWALLREADLTPLASSSPEFEGSARAELLKTLNSQIEAKRSAVKEQPGTVPVRHTALHVRPNGALGRSVLVSLKNTRFTTDAEGAGVHVRARTDAQGNVVSVEVLHSRVPEYTADLVSYIQESMSVRVKEPPAVPLELYGYVGVFKNRRIGYVLSALAAQ